MKMERRVECRRCRCHRDLARSAGCLVCGAVAFVDVEPSPGDLASGATDEATTEVIEAAALIDRALFNGEEVTKWHRHALRLSVACRRLARVRREEATT